MPTHRTVLVIAGSDELDNDYGHQLQQDRGFVYQILTEQNSAEASVLSQAQQIDGILLKLYSFHSGGFDILRQLKEQMGEQCPPIVVIGGDNTEMAVRAFKNGAADYLIRERVTADDLRLTVRNAIENAELRRELQRSQEKFQTSVENMLDCFGIFSSIRDESGQIIDFRIDYLNGAACENNRMPKARQIGRGLCEILPAHRESGLFDEYCRLVETGEPLIKDSLIYADNYGEQHLVRAFDIRATRLHDGFVASWRDITDRKQLELNLNQTVSDLQTLLDIIPVGIAIATDSTCTQMQSNAYLRQLLDIQPGHNISKSLPADQQPPYRVFQNGQEIPADDLPMQVAARLGIDVRDTEFDILLSDGRIRQILSYATPLRNDQNQIRGVIGAFLDITERNQVAVALQASQQRYRDLAEAMPQMVWTADATGAVNYWNQRWYEYTGLSEAESIGLAGASAIHPEEHDRTLEQWRQAIADGSPFEIEYRVRRWDGVYHWFICRAISTRDCHNQITGWIGTITDINNQKHIEIALQQNQERLDLAMKAAKMGSWDWDIQTGKVNWSANLEHLFGMAPGCFDGQYETVKAMIHPDDLPWVEQAIYRAIYQRENYNIEFRFLKSDGTVRWALGLGRVFYDAIGNPITMTGVDMDISERKQVEADLRTSEERFRQMADHASMMVWVTDRNGYCTYLSQSWYEFTGQTEATGLGLGWLNAVHPEDREMSKTIFLNANEHQESFRLEYRLRRQDGEYRWAIDAANPWFGEDGIFQGYIGSVIDISDRKQAEEALRQSEERYRTLFEFIDEGFCVIEMLFDQNSSLGTSHAFRAIDYRFLETNPAFEKQTGLTNVQGKRMRELIPNHEEHWFEIYGNVARTGEPNRFESYAEAMHRWYDVYAFRIGQPESHKIAVLFSDITDRKFVEQEREKLLTEEQAARAEAERANRIKDEFLAVLSHELRSPLNPILGWSKLLQTRKLDATKTAEALAAIERNAKLQTQLIDDLLDVAKILRGKLSLNMDSVNLSSIVEAAIETVRTTAAAKSISLYSQSPNIGQVFGDAARLQQIVWNLLSNAIKFTPSGGQVTIRLERSDQATLSFPASSASSALPASPSSYADITVIDTGKGINPTFLPHIFESFRQEDASITRQYGGLGLGLAIVRQLVEAHGGTIIADSPGEGLGATFTVRLPLLNAEPEIQQPDELPSQALDLTGIRVLTVDDDPDARELLTVLLTHYGAEVLAVASATEVLANLESFQPDVLVSDIGMPNTDGYFLIQQIRTRTPEQGGIIPAIALTAYARESDYQQAITSGYQQHVTKPLEPEQLVRAVMALVPAKDR